jgi:hypothetical protein
MQFPPPLMPVEQSLLTVLVGCTSRFAAPSPCPILRHSIAGDFNRFIVALPNCELTSENCQFTSPLIPILATLLPRTERGMPQNRANPSRTTPLNPLNATVTNAPLRNSFAYHSYVKTGDGVAVTFCRTSSSHNGTLISCLLAPKLTTENCELLTLLSPTLRHPRPLGYNRSFAAHRKGLAEEPCTRFASTTPCLARWKPSFRKNLAK